MSKLSQFVTNNNMFQITATQVAPAGYLGSFGRGQWRTFQSSGTFIVPTGITQIRVRVVGAGGGGRNSGAGGGGGGFAYGVFGVNSGDSFAVVVGMGGSGGATPVAGGLSSFGALISE